MHARVNNSVFFPWRGDRIASQNRRGKRENMKRDDSEGGKNLLFHAFQNSEKLTKTKNQTRPNGMKNCSAFYGTLYIYIRTEFIIIIILFFHSDRGSVM